MRLTILTMCALISAGVFATMLLSIRNARLNDLCPDAVRQSLAVELVWAAIPWLMIVAAALPAATAIVTSGHVR